MRLNNGKTLFSLFHTLLNVRGQTKMRLHRLKSLTFPAFFCNPKTGFVIHDMEMRNACFMDILL